MEKAAAKAEDELESAKKAATAAKAAAESDAAESKAE